MIEYLTSRDFIITLIKIVVIFGGVMNVVGLLSWVERKMMARVQMRPGPTRVGPFGLLQPFADLLKFVFKEEVIPLSVGLLFIFAVTSLGVYGIALGGWASNSKYPLMGAMRSAAQMISYELSLTLSVVGVLMIANTLSLRELVISQQNTWLGFIPRWNIFLQPIAFIVYVISGTAETNRLPFDLAESEQELVAGWHTEYSSMKFLMFMMAEYANMIAVSSLATILFLGGWNGPMFGPQLLQMALPVLWFVLKVGFFVFFYVLLRSTIPRFRYDQLMTFGWKVLLPISLANILVTSFVVAIS
jgi:NADH-quinone oxidoreductase subunit H